MECEEAGVEISDGAAIAGEAIQWVPGYAVPARRVETRAVEGEEFRAAACCQLLYPVGEGLTLMRGGAFEELKQQTGGVAQGCSLPEDTEAVMCGVGVVLAILTIAVGVHGFHAAANAVQVRVEAVWEILVTSVRTVVRAPVTPTHPVSVDDVSKCLQLSKSAIQLWTPKNESKKACVTDLTGVCSKSCNPERYGT